MLNEDAQWLEDELAAIDEMLPLREHHGGGGRQKTGSRPGGGGKSANTDRS
jgi:hypothetical protein